MKRYLIKVTAKKDDHITYYGVNNFILGSYGAAAVNAGCFKRVNVSDVKRHGYKRLCDAKRNLIYKHGKSFDGENSDYEIVENIIDEIYNKSILLDTVC